MKKKTIYVVIAIAVVAILAILASNNSVYSLKLDPAQVTRITLSQSGTTVDVLDKDDIVKIVDNFNSLQLRADKQFSTGYVFKVAFYDNDDILADLTINCRGLFISEDGFKQYALAHLGKGFYIDITATSGVSENELEKVVEGLVIR